MTDLIITKINETWMKVTCTEHYMELDIQDNFSFQVEQNKSRWNKHWNGIIKLYDLRNHQMMIGLLVDLLELADKKKWSYAIDPDLVPEDDEYVSLDDVKTFVEQLQPHHNKVPIKPHLFQLEAIQYIMNMQRAVILAATSSGKSLIIYSIIRIFQLLSENPNKRIFIVVPNVSLVEQLYSDFKDYSTFTGSKWNVSKWCQKMSGGYSKDITAQVIITTWQTMSKLPERILDDIEVLICDECHTASANVLSTIAKSCKNASVKVGLTGTLNGIDWNEMTITGLFGKPKRFVSAKELIDSGKATPIEVHVSILEYTDSDRIELIKRKGVTKDPKVKYELELDYLAKHNERTKLILNMIDIMPNNSLVLFDRVEEYGNIIFEKFKANFPKHKCYLITGSTPKDDREQIRKQLEKDKHAVLFATSQTTSTGISINNLHNLFLISSSKSKIRVLQSIGRMMRLNKNKHVARIFDIVDNLTWNGNQNYSVKHEESRLNYYVSEQFKIKFDQYHLN